MEMKTVKTEDLNGVSTPDSCETSNVEIQKDSVIREKPEERTEQLLLEFE